MNFTRRNHFNPCFWTANWNPNYFSRVRAGTHTSQLNCRDQQVYVLNVKSAKIYKTAVANVHFDKNLGIAEITPDDLREYCRRNHPSEYEQVCLDLKNHPETVYLDFEDMLTGIENGRAYSTLKDVISRQNIRVPHEKAMLAGFILVHWHRSHAMLNSMIEWSEELGFKKLEFFIRLKWDLGNPDYLYQLAMLVAPFHWHYYSMDRDMFPLNDSPVLITPSSIMIALSPRLMLEIDRTRCQSDCSICYSNHISLEKVDEFRHRTIRNTYREIIFSSPDLLEEWLDTDAFKSRHNLMKTKQNYNLLMTKDGNEEVWNINALANQ